MKWTEFEPYCVDFLNQQYGTFCSFVLLGKSDSTAPDIAVYKNDSLLFNIEAKSGTAQSGQFVLFPDKEKKEFIYSNRNMTPIFQESKEIISYMNDNFDNYANLSTRGEELYIPKDLMYNWVKYYYKNIKKENYFISEYNNDIIILPIEKLEQYFDISCKYRIKKSGSTDPSLKHKEEIEKILLKNNLNFDDITFKGKKCFVDIKNGVKNKYKLDGDKYNYQFAKEEVFIS